MRTPAQIKEARLNNLRGVVNIIEREIDTQLRLFKTSIVINLSVDLTLVENEFLREYFTEDAKNSGWKLSDWSKRWTPQPTGGSTTTIEFRLKELEQSKPITREDILNGKVDNTILGVYPADYRNL